MRTKRILVIDDEDGIRRALRTVLERAGYEVREARSGQDALRLWREEESDLVITDIHMPGKGGIETIRAAGRGRVAISCVTHLSGPIQTMDKPFGIAKVLECVSGVLQRAEPREGGA